MKITTALTIVSSLLLAAGCAHDEHRSAQFDDTLYSPPTAVNGGTTSQSSTIGASTEQNSSTAGISANESNAGLVQAQGAASDTAIETQIRQSLAANTELAPVVPGLQITVNNGSVTINGSVN